MREKSLESDPQLALGQAKRDLAREDFAEHFVATVDARATLK
jgi:hypothetical protein